MRLIVRGRQVVARMPRLLKTGVLVALVAVFTLGGVSAIGSGRFGVPTAHAASSCTTWVGQPLITNGINDLSHPDPNSPKTITAMEGDAHAYMEAYVDSSGNYCLTVQGEADIAPGSHGGYLWAGLYSCSGQLLAGTNIVSMSGNGTPPGSPSYPYSTIETSPVYQTCGFVAVEVWYYDNNHHKVYMQATSPTNCGESGCWYSQ